MCLGNNAYIQSNEKEIYLNQRCPLSLEFNGQNSNSALPLSMTVAQKVSVLRG